MSERFFVASIADRTPIDGVEAHHLSHVLRARVGERVTLFDGSGREALAEIVEIGRSQVETRTLDVREVDRELPLRIEIAMPLPKGDRAGLLVEKLTELGVARLAPLITQRSVSSASGSAKAEKPEKLLRKSIEACKQCGRNRLLEIGEPTPFAEYLSSGFDAGRWLGSLAEALPASLRGVHSARWIAHADATAAHYAVAEKLASDGNAGPRPQTVSVLVGPEGGFTDDEVRAAIEAGWYPVGIGRTILRMETAAIALAAVIAATVKR